MTNVCVIGLGKIGFPLALVLAKANHRVSGVDTNPSILKKFENNIGLNSIERALLAKYWGNHFFATNNLSEGLNNSEVVFIAIGTGVSPTGVPELANLFGLIGQICNLPDQAKGKLFVLKSTLPVGTTKTIASLMEKSMGLECGKDFYLAFCPERVLGDKAIFEMESLPKIIGGVNRASSEKAMSIYSTIGGKLIIMEGPESAELIKLMDNAYRQTVFAFSNDFALLAEQYGLNATKLIKSANDSYPRNNIPLPSPGVSGYCLTKDPLYLEQSFKDIASKRGFSSVWYNARKTNDYMPIHVIDLLRTRLESLGKNFKDTNVMVCGVSYKENTDDVRNSHGLEIAAYLREAGANVCLWDPLISDRNIGYTFVENPQEVIKSLDALIFTVKHDEFEKLNDNSEIVWLLRQMRTPILVDGWGIFQQLIDSNEVHYLGVGIPNKIR